VEKIVHHGDMHEMISKRVQNLQEYLAAAISTRMEPEMAQPFTTFQKEHDGIEPGCQEANF
jgi:hypothetical protein